jgi:hypothetical protein
MTNKNKKAEARSSRIVDDALLRRWIAACDPQKSINSSNPHYLNLDQVVEHPYLARFMENHTVLCYRNGDGWYEIHPLVRATVERLARQQKAAGDASS